MVSVMATEYEILPMATVKTLNVQRNASPLSHERETLMPLQPRFRSEPTTFPLRWSLL